MSEDTQPQSASSIVNIFGSSMSRVLPIKSLSWNLESSSIILRRQSLEPVMCTATFIRRREAVTTSLSIVEQERLIRHSLCQELCHRFLHSQSTVFILIPIFEMSPTSG